MARPSAQGQAMIRTATAAVNASVLLCPVASQPTRVSRASTSTIGTNTAEIRSARRCTSALPDWASSTSRAIRASAVSLPTRVARTTSRPPALTVAPVTSSPGPTSTGTGSPVSIDASTADVPSSTTPSVAICSPGPDHEPHPDPEVLDVGDVLAPVVEDRDLLGPERQQRLQGGAGAPLRLGLEVAPGDEEQGHPGRDLEVQGVGRGAGRHRHRGADDARVAPEQGVDRPAVGGQDADADQRVHGGGAVAEVDPRGAVERPRTPDHHRRREGEGQPHPLVELEEGHHRQRDDGDGQGRRHEQALASLLDRLRVVVVVPAAVPSSARHRGGGLRSRGSGRRRRAPPARRHRGRR